jgi:hypothetical protein
MMEHSELKRPVNSKSTLVTLYVYGASKNPFY